MIPHRLSLGVLLLLATSGCDRDPASGAELAAPPTPLQADYVLSGEQAGDYAGVSSDNAGDVNGDGEADLLVGAFYAGPRTSSDHGPGTAYLLLGPVTASANLADADAKLRGMRTNDITAMSLAGLGDVDLDGFDDILVGSQHYGGTGGAFFVPGPVHGEIDLFFRPHVTGEAYADHLGVSVAGPGDVTGDGYPDALIGAKLYGGETTTGAAYVIAGPMDQVVDRHVANASNVAFAKYTGEALSNLFGNFVASAGDIDGDGLTDVLLAAPYSSSNGWYSGTVYLDTDVRPGNSPITEVMDARIIGLPGSTTGLSASAAGDINGDGHGDVLIGSYKDATAGTDAGAAYAFLGPALPFGDVNEAVAVMLGDRPDARFGYSVTTLGDLDADGLDDVAVGAPSWTDGPEFQGLAEVYLAPLEGSVHPAFRVTGVNGGHAVGVSVRGLGDIDGDGLFDLGVGAWGANDAAGEVQLFSGLGS